MKVAVIGHGVFGSFLLKEILRVSPTSLVATFDAADTLILAVPSSAYEVVAEQWKDKHLVNVCSVQSKTNYICSKFTNDVTGIHPLFGPRSGVDNRTAIVTKRCDKSDEVIELFEKMNAEVFDCIDGDGWRHDEIMAKTHIPVVKLQEQIKIIMKNAQEIDERFYPTSFKRLTAFAETFGDMPIGTLRSILDNPMVDD